MELNEQVLNWAFNKGILEAGTPSRQVDKTLEEVQELQDEILDIGLEVEGAEEKAMMERGDIEVTLIILDHMLGFDRDKCLQLALDKINTREGRMVDGQFVKEEDL